MASVSREELSSKIKEHSRGFSSRLHLHAIHRRHPHLWAETLAAVILSNELREKTVFRRAQSFKETVVTEAESVSDLDQITFDKQGDASLNTHEAVHKRLHLRAHPHVEQAIKRCALL